MIGGEDEPPLLGNVLLSVETYGDVEIFQQGLGKVYTTHMGIGFQKTVDAIFLNGAFDEVEYETRNFSGQSRRFPFYNLFYINV